MAENSSETDSTSLPMWREPVARRWLASAAIVAIGMVVGGFLLGDGLVRAKQADRAVTVRGLSEREVLADLATWTISYSSTATDLAAAQAGADRDTASIESFFKDLGFPAEALQPTGVNVNYYTDNNGVGRYTVRQRLSLRTNDIERAQDAVKRQAELVRRGVLLEDGSGMSYTFTELEAIKPAMIAEATKDARSAAEQFAEDSGVGVGSIRHATQGYFSIDARDGETGGWGGSDSPHKKVRVVTTVDFSLD